MLTPREMAEEIREQCDIMNEGYEPYADLDVEAVAQMLNDWRGQIMIQTARDVRQEERESARHPF